MSSPPKGAHTVYLPTYGASLLKPCPLPNCDVRVPDEYRMCICKDELTDAAPPSRGTELGSEKTMRGRVPSKNRQKTFNQAAQYSSPVHPSFRTNHQQKHSLARNLRRCRNEERCSFMCHCCLHRNRIHVRLSKYSHPLPVSGLRYNARNSVRLELSADIEKLVNLPSGSSGSQGFLS